MSHYTKTYSATGFFLSILLILLASVNSAAQTHEIDSLENWITQNPSEEVEIGQVLARLSYLYNSRDNRKGIELGRKSLELGLKLNNDPILARAYNSVGVNYYIAGQYDSAIYNYERAVTYKLKIDDQSGAAATRVNLGVIYWRQDNYPKAVLILNEALDYFLEHDEWSHQAAAYTNLGLVYLDIDDFEAAIGAFEKAKSARIRAGLDPSNVYRNLGMAYNYEGEYEMAIDYGKKALETAVSNKNEVRLIDAHLDLINPYIGLGQYDTAEYHGQEALKLSVENENKVKQARSFSRLAYLNYRQSKYPEAIELYKKAIKVRMGLKNKSALGNNYMGMGRSKFAMGDVSGAVLDFQKAITYAEKVHSYATLQNATRRLSDYYKKKGDYQKAYEYQLRYQAAKDSVDNLDKFKAVSRVHSQFVQDRLRQELATQQAQNELQLHNEIDRQRLVNYVAVSAVVVVLILLAMVYRVYQVKKKAALRLEEKNKLILEQKDELAFKSDKLQIVNSQLKSLAEFRTDLTRMIAHDMKNPLNAIIGLSSTGSHDKRIKNITQSGYQLLNLVTNMLAVDKFQSTNYQPNPSSFPLDQIILEAKRDVEILLEAKAIRFESLIPKMICVKVDRASIKRVLVNLFSNAIKYSPNEGKVIVDKIKVQNDQIYLKVTDQGAGIPADRLPHVFDKFWQSNAKESGFAASTGLGLTFCKMAIEAHGGKIWAESEISKGTSIYFSLPLEIDNTCEKTLATLFEEEREVNEEMEALIEESEYEQIAEYAGFLKGLKIHQVSAITRVLKDLERQEIKSQWKTDLQTAVYQADQQRYDDLLQVLEKDY